MTQEELLTLNWPAAEAYWQAAFVKAMNRGDDEAAVEALQSAVLSERLADLQRERAAA